jgi:hypothetical protein
MLGSCLANSSTLKMDATCSSKTSVDFQRTAWNYIPRDRTLQNHFSENLESYSIYVSLLTHLISSLFSKNLAGPTTVSDVSDVSILPIFKMK